MRVCILNMTETLTHIPDDRLFAEKLHHLIQSPQSVGWSLLQNCYQTPWDFIVLLRYDSYEMGHIITPILFSKILSLILRHHGTPFLHHKEHSVINIESGRSAAVDWFLNEA